MCVEHDWLSAVTTSYKFACDKISENFVEIYLKILNFGKLLKNYIAKLYMKKLFKKLFRLVGGGCIPASTPPPPPRISATDYFYYIFYESSLVPFIFQNLLFTSLSPK